MTLVNKIENAIKELEGGRFQKLGDEYLRKKYNFKIVSLGSQEGTDKTTKGTPDSYAEEDGKYVYIMYGTHKSVISKLEGDIQSVKEKILDENIAEDKVRRLICCHTSSNITIKQKEDLEKIAEPYQLELIGINEIANDLKKLDFQYLAKEYLSISESTEQIWSINDFIRIHDESKTNAPISNDYIGDISEIINTIKSSEKRIFLISAKPGTGKTRLAIEICSLLDRNKYNIICVKSNNQDIYQDVKRNLNLHKENIVFIDDVNTTQNYISTLGLLNTTNNISFILTVRDYAKEDVINNIRVYGYNNIEPELLKDDNFKKLLSQFSQTEFTRKEIEHIKTISKSNPRVAVIAAKLSSSQDLINFNDEIDILKDYYEEILNKNNIIYAEQKTLFILSYLKKIRLESLEENQEFNKLLKITDITNTDFKSAVEKLHERELCNIYNDKIVKIADQSLDDYIVIKFLVNKKISILEILHELYPVNGQRVVQILNQCSNFIMKESDLEGVSDAVKSYYNENNFESDELKEKFLIQFGVLLPLEAISHVKNKIDNIEPQAYTKTNFINQKDKKESIEDSVLNIVFVTTRTKYCSQILQLLLKYFDKNPNKISEVYSILEANYGLVTEREYIDYTLAENKDHTYKLFQKLGENDINFAVEVLKKIDELKMGSSNLGYMVLHTINGFRDKKEIYKKFIRFAINRPYYYYNNMLEDIIKNDSRIILEMLEETNNEQFAIRLVNLGVEFLENSNQKLILFNLLRTKGFGKKSFQEIHFSPYSHLFTGSHVPVLELEKELLERIKEIFETDIDYINLLLYLDKLIDGKRKAIERELEKEF